MAATVAPAQATSEVLSHLEQVEVGLAAVARSDPSAFCGYVLRDERTGRRIEQAPHHEAWHDLISAEDRLVLWAHVEAGKSQQVSIGRVLWELGRDPSLRVGVCSNTQGQAEKICRTIARYAEQSSELRAVFPGLRPADPWTSTQLFFDRPVFSKDPSVQAFGVHGNVVGARLDLLILDDVLDYENCRTPGGREELWAWYNATLPGRLTAHAKVVTIGTAYHPEDLLHRFADQPGVRALRYPVLDDAGRPRWPSRWPLERVESRRRELGPLEFARQMLCVARSDDQARFKREWIDVAMRRGEGKETCYGLQQVPPGHRIYTGVDLAVQKHSAADLTVLFTIDVHPDETREVLQIEAGRWSGPEIVDRIFDAHRRYQGISIVENNAAQDFIVQFARHRGAVPIRAFTTGMNKAHPEFGVESIAAEMESGKWIIPNIGGQLEPEIEQWVREMLFYDPRGHTGDRLMASWFAREGARLGAMKAEVGRIDLMSR